MNSVDYKLATTYGGIVGRLARLLLGLRWNHVLIVEWIDDQPCTTYESNLRGVHRHPFDAQRDLAWEHEWYEATEPFSAMELAAFQGYCEGACGKWYALHIWPLLAWRALRRPRAVGLIPAETCVTFVNAACALVGRPVSQGGAEGLPDDIMQSAHWTRMERVRR